MPGIKLKPFFTYYGGKYRIAPRYPQPDFSMLVEPFAGSAGYSVRHWDRKVMLYDLDPIIWSTWDYLIRATSKEIMRLPLEVEDVRDLKVCQEAKWLIGWWINKGCASPCNVVSSRVRGGTRPDSHWGQVIRERIADQVGRIKHWQVFNRDFSSAPSTLATWFIDPPYQTSGAHYRVNDVDYLRLKEWTLTRSGQVICCGQEGDDWADFSHFTMARANNGEHLGEKSGKFQEWWYYNDRQNVEGES